MAEILEARRWRAPAVGFPLLGVVAALLLLFVVNAPRAQAANVDCTSGAPGVKTFTGASGGLFHDAANWTPSGIPGSGDTVCSSATKTIVVDQDATVAGARLLGTLNQTGGTLTIGSSSLVSTINNGTLVNLSSDAPLTLTGTSSLTTVRGTGVTTIASGATAALTDSATVSGPHTVRNVGALNLAGTVNLFCGGILQNQGTIAITVPTSGYEVIHDSSGCGSGSMTSSAGSVLNKKGNGTLDITASWTNNGTADIDGGEIQLSGPGGTGGTWDVAATTKLNIVVDRTFAAASSFVGAGRIQVSGGTVDFGGESIPNGGLSGGNITGNATFSSSFAWTGGDLTGVGTTTLGSAVASTYPDGGQVANGHRLLNQGTLTLAGSVYLQCGGVLETPGTINVSVAQPSTYAVYDYAGCTPAGKIVAPVGSVFNKNGTGDFQIDVTWDALGTTNINGGTLTPYRSTGDAGTWDVDSGARLLLLTDRTFGAGASIPGAGLIEVGGGTVDFGGRTLPNVKLAGGTITGNATFSSAFAWTGGLFDGAGTTTLGPASAVTYPDGGQVANGHRLVNKGTLALPGTVILGCGGILENQATINASVSQPSAYAVSDGYGCTPAGKLVSPVGSVFNKNGDGEFQVQVEWDNLGTANVNGGTLTLYGNTGDAGKWDVDSGARLLLPSGRTFGAGSTIPGAGLVEVSGGTVDFGGATLPNVKLAGGTITGNATFSSAFTWTGGLFDGDGTTTLGPAVAAAYLDGGQVNNGHRLVNKGTLGVGGSASLLCGGILENQGTLNLEVAQPATHAINDYHGCTPAGMLVSPAGSVLNKNGTGEFQVQLAWDNLGTANVNSGTLTLYGNTGDAGTWDVDSGARLLLPSGRTFGVGSSILGAGLVEVSGGTVDFGGSTLPHVKLSGGYITGDATVSSSLTWTGGQFDGAGTTTLGSAVASTYPDGGYVTNGHRLVNKGTLTLAGSVYLLCGGILENQATMQMSVAQPSVHAIYDYMGCTPAGKVVAPAGSVFDKNGTGDFQVQVAWDNLGTANVNGGTLTLYGNTGDAGKWDVDSGARLLLMADREFGPTSSIPGPGLVEVGSGTVDFGGASLPNVKFSGGTITGDATFTGSFVWLYGARLDGAGITTIASGATATLPDDATVAYGHTLRNSGTATLVGHLRLECGGIYDNRGTTTFTITGANTAQVYDYWGCTPAGTFLSPAGSVLNKNGTGTLQFTVPTWNNLGTLNVSEGTVETVYALENYDANTKILTGGTWNLTGPMKSHGDIETIAADVTFNAGSGWTNSDTGASAITNLKKVNSSGTLTLNRNLTAVAFSNVGAVNVNSGTFTVPSYTQTNGTTTVASGATLRSTGGTVAISAGTLRGAGTVQGNVTGAGTVAPGTSPGLLSVTGTWPAGDGTFNVEIGGTTAGTQHDKLAVSGAVTLTNRKLVLSTINGYAPVVGHTFTIVTGSSRTGTFASISGDDIPGDKYYSVAYTANSVIVTVKALEQLSVSDVTVVEPNTGTINASFTVSLDSPSTRRVTAAYSTADGTAKQPADYTLTAGTVTFPAGTTTQTVSVPVKSDALDEDDETVIVNLTNPTRAKLLDPSGTGTIGDDPGDLPPVLTVADVSVGEGDLGPVAAVVPVTLSGASGKTITVAYTTTPATATAGEDFVSQSDTLTFAPGETAKNVSVAALGDQDVEGNESLTVDASGPTNVTISDGQGAVTIVDDDVAPTWLAISDSRAVEGNTTMTYSITRSGPLDGASSVTVTALGNSNAINGSDYNPFTTQTVDFAADETLKTVTVSVRADTVPEFEESVDLRLTNPVGAVIWDDTGVGVIRDDDFVPNDSPATFSISDAVVDEGAGAAVFTVTRSGNTTQRAYVVATAASSALRNVARAAVTDFGSGTTATLQFDSGVVTKTFSVPVAQDTRDEDNEYFAVNLSSPVRAWVSDGVAAGIIVDDEGTVVPGPTTFLSVLDTRVLEGDSGTQVAIVTVQRSGDTSGATTVNAVTHASSSALAGSDFTNPGTVSLAFAAGETAKTFAITVAGDTRPEIDEAIQVFLSGPSGAALSDEWGAVWIVDQDPGVASTISIEDAKITESPLGSRQLSFTIRRAGFLNEAASVIVDTLRAKGTAYTPATAGSDFVPVGSLVVTWARNEGAAKTVNVTINDDALVEPNEHFFVELRQPSRVGVTDLRAIGTIASNDAG